MRVDESLFCPRIDVQSVAHVYSVPMGGRE